MQKLVKKMIVTATLGILGFFASFFVLISVEMTETSQELIMLLGIISCIIAFTSGVWAHQLQKLMSDEWVPPRP